MYPYILAKLSTWHLSGPGDRKLFGPALIEAHGIVFFCCLSVITIIVCMNNQRTTSPL